MALVSELFLNYPTAHTLVRDGKIIFLNPAAVRLFGGVSAEEFIGRPVLDFIHPLDREYVRHRIGLLGLDRRQNEPTETRILTLDGQVRILATASAVAFDEDGGSVIIATGIDVTSFHRLQDELRSSEETFRRLFENMHDLFYKTNAADELTLIGPGVERVFGYRQAEVYGMSVASVYLIPAQRAQLWARLRKYGEVNNRIVKLRHKDGHALDIAVTAKMTYDSAGNFTGVEGLLRDVTEELRLRRELQILATIDNLTGLLNRRTFLEQANQAVGIISRYREPMIFMIVDIDNFKEINDNLGHLMGDEAIRKIVAAGRTCLRENDIFGRLGGDEFGVILRRCEPLEALQICQRILARVRDVRIRLRGKGADTHMSVSLGLTPICRQDRPFARALARADRALYLAKSSGRGCCAYQPLEGLPLLPSLATDGSLVLGAIKDRV
ncbi:MAG: sensor domain-containing diguanylate cyclase [Acidithiobacillus sp.]|uniref:sensor domain-containing diguanylate cyclase n=1 Tax=Acidithiobacillus sp. TaxID=1872118 RepID=UPI003D0658BD